MRVIFVCTGNTCRSPMAQALLQSLAEKKYPGLSAESAGLFASAGQPVSENAVRVLAERFHIPRFFHSARPLTREMIATADLVIGMTEGHRRMMEEKFGKNEKFIAFPVDVGDPFGGSTEVYEKTALAIVKGMEILFEKGLFHD